MALEVEPTFILPQDLLEDWNDDVLTLPESIATPVPEFDHTMPWLNFISEDNAAVVPAPAIVEAQTVGAVELSPEMMALAFQNLDSLGDLQPMVDVPDSPSSGDDASPQRSPVPVTPEYMDEHIGDAPVESASIAPHMVYSSPSSASASPQPESQPQKKSRKRPRKRQKISSEEDSAIIGKTAVSLPREQLLALSSKELEDYIDSIAQQRPLTKEEQKEFKRQRRLIKNRESASISRQRKKVFISELQGNTHALIAENARLRAEVEELSKQNHSLKEEVSKLQNTIRQSKLLSTIYQKFSVSKPGVTTNVKAAGICLMIVLFSIGMLFHPARVGDTGPTLPFENLFKGLTASPSPASSAVIPYQTRARVIGEYGASETKSTSEQMSQNPAYAPVFAHRHLLQKDESPVEEEIITPNRARQFGSSMPTMVKSFGSSDTTSSAPMDIDTTSSTPLNNDETTVPLSSTSPATIEQKPYHVIRMDSTPSDSSVLRPSDWRPNTTYLLCNDIQELVPVDAASTRQVDPSSPFVVAVMVPQRAFGSEYLQASDSQVDKEMVEVSCQVLDISFTPFEVSTKLTPSLAASV